ncbi:hypothetical protein R1flu_024187 [Riccia fluitans]|uniref:Myb/SANT-like DNA-binding domain-containing protein n=1 Tax=Riccia fluitans TaxID=41844 RepID=A0ABD1XU71_9MARC
MTGGGVRVAGMLTTPSVTMGGGVMAVAKEGGVVKSEKKKDGNEWTDRAVELLLELYEQKWRGVSFGNLRVKDWEHVASTMDERYHWQGERKTFLQCKNKIENLKKRYKLEREKKNENGEIMSDWPWFGRLHEIIGKAPKQVGLIEDSENGTLALGLGSTVEGPDVEKECEGEGQGGGLSQLGQIVPIAMRDDSKMRALTESQISSERASFMETPPGKDRKQGSTAACGTRCMQNVPEVTGKCGRKRRRNADRSPVKDLAASFSNFFNAMAKVEVERMQMLRELISNNTRKRPRIASAALDNDQCRWCSAHGMSAAPGRDTIHQKLVEAFSPTNLEVEDVSSEQLSGLQLGAAKTNFNVRVVSPLFEGQSLIQRHRMIYKILQEELKELFSAMNCSTPILQNERMLLILLM